jgi:hypothetical protein
MRTGDARHRHSTAIQMLLWPVVLIHLLPLPGLFGAEMLQRLYALSDLKGSVELLLQHRALLFALLCLPLLRALLRAHSLGFSISLLFASDLGFALLCLQAEPLPSGLHRVLAFDLASIALLIVAWVVDRRQARGGPSRRCGSAER